MIRIAPAILLKIFPASSIPHFYVNESRISTYNLYVHIRRHRSCLTDHLQAPTLPYLEPVCRRTRQLIRFAQERGRILDHLLPIRQNPFPHPSQPARRGRAEYARDSQCVTTSLRKHSFRFRFTELSAAHRHFLYFNIEQLDYVKG